MLERGFRYIFILGVTLLVFLSLLLGSFPSIFIVENSNAAQISVTVKIALCGDSFVDTTEDCDNAELDGQSCTTQGFTSGPLSCDISCSFDTSSCTTSSGGGGGGGGSTVGPVTISTGAMQ